MIIDDYAFFIKVLRKRIFVFQDEFTEILKLFFVFVNR